MILLPFNGDKSATNNFSRYINANFNKQIRDSLLAQPRNPTYDLIDKQKEANEMLEKIVENTSVLKELVEINRETQLKTEELTYVMRAIYDVAKADSKEEADTLFSIALKTINESGEAVGNITNLVSLLMGIYNTVKIMI